MNPANVKEEKLSLQEVKAVMIWDKRLYLVNAKETLSADSNDLQPNVTNSQLMESKYFGFLYQVIDVGAIKI